MPVEPMPFYLGQVELPESVHPGFSWLLQRRWGRAPLPLKQPVSSTLRTPLSALGRSPLWCRGTQRLPDLPFPRAPFSPISSPYPSLCFSLAAQSTPEISQSSLHNVLPGASLHRWALSSMQVTRGLCVSCPIPTEPRVWQWERTHLTLVG